MVFFPEWDVKTQSCFHLGLQKAESSAPWADVWHYFLIGIEVLCRKICASAHSPCGFQVITDTNSLGVSFPCKICLSQIQVTELILGVNKLHGMALVIMRSHRMS